MAHHTPIIVRVPGGLNPADELWLRPCDARQLIKRLQWSLDKWEARKAARRARVAAHPMEGQ